MGQTTTTGMWTELDAGPNAQWPHVFTAATSDDDTSSAQQQIIIFVTSLPEGGANYRVAKTTANGNWFFANAVALELGGNTITVAAAAFARTVEFQFSSPDIEFSSFAHNGVELFP